MFLFEDRVSTGARLLSTPWGKLPQLSSKITLPSRGCSDCLATPRRCLLGPRTAPGCGGCPARKGVPQERVRGAGWGWGAPLLLLRRHHGLRTSPVPLTWLPRVTPVARKHCPYLGADPVRDCLGQPRPSVPAREGRSVTLRREPPFSGGGQTAFPGVISYL